MLVWVACINRYETNKDKKGWSFDQPFLFCLWEGYMVQIQEYRFGYIKISGKTYTHDLKIIGNTVIPNWWRSEGHKVLQKDIKDILEQGVEIIVIGQGDPGLMKVDPSLKNYLKKQKIKLIEKPTKDAIFEFNKLYKEGRKVGAGFHLTC